MPYDTRHGIASVPFSGRLFQNVGNVQLFYDMFCGFLFAKAFFFEFLVKFFHLVVQKMPYSLHYRYRIGFFFRILTEFNKFIEQFGGIGHIKIPCNDKIAVNPIILAKERMYILYAVLSESSVAHMSQQNLSYVGKKVFLRLHIIF